MSWLPSFTGATCRVIRGLGPEEARKRSYCLRVETLRGGEHG